MMKFSLCLCVSLFVFNVCESVDLIRTFDKDFRSFYENAEQQEDHKGSIWAVLVAGSKNYYNYRHQADVCHAYQILHKHGVPDDHIIVMMQDDIANDSENPTPGIVINHPDGDDVYNGVPKDYTGDEVTPENFLNVLTGAGSGKVLKSGKNDHVFVFFADHGAPGLIAFPTKELYKDDLAKAINTMHTNNMYKEMVFYVEACESGSMFLNTLPNNINVYATTAANEKESSYACYFDAKRQTYLGDRYSVSWMEDSDARNIEKETLYKQYETTKSHTNQSHVQQFGNLTIGEVDEVGQFEGLKNVKESTPMRQIFDDVPSPDVKLHILKNKIIASSNSDEKKFFLQELEAEHLVRSKVTNLATAIAYHATAGVNGIAKRVLTNTPQLLDMECYRGAVQTFDEKCIDLQEVEYAYRHVYVLANLCDEGFSLNRIEYSLNEICK